MFPCSDWVTTPILENIPDSLCDIEIVKNQWIIVRNGIIHKLIPWPCHNITCLKILVKIGQYATINHRIGFWSLLVYREVRLNRKRPIFKICCGKAVELLPLQCIASPSEVHLLLPSMPLVKGIVLGPSSRPRSADGREGGWVIC